MLMEKLSEQQSVRGLEMGGLRVKVLGARQADPGGEDQGQKEFGTEAEVVFSERTPGSVGKP